MTGTAGTHARGWETCPGGRPPAVCPATHPSVSPPLRAPRGKAHSRAGGQRAGLRRLASGVSGSVASGVSQHASTDRKAWLPCPRLWATYSTPPDPGLSVLPRNPGRSQPSRRAARRDREDHANRTPRFVSGPQ